MAKSQLRLINCDGTLRKNGNISFSLMDQPFRKEPLRQPGT